MEKKGWPCGDGLFYSLIAIGLQPAFMLAGNILIKDDFWLFFWHGRSFPPARE